MIPRSRVCGESTEQFGYLEEDMHQLNGDGDSCIYKIKGMFFQSYPKLVLFDTEIRWKLHIR